MFTRNALPLLALAAAVAGPSTGCTKRLDPDKYGEVITKVPPELNQPFPLPELQKPDEEPVSGEPKAETPVETEPSEANPGEPTPKGSE